RSAISAAASTALAAVAEPSVPTATVASIRASLPDRARPFQGPRPSGLALVRPAPVGQTVEEHLDGRLAIGLVQLIADLVEAVTDLRGLTRGRAQLARDLGERLGGLHEAALAPDRQAEHLA